MTTISVITPTWKRHQLLTERCIPSVFTQTWGDVEHVIVSDGPDRPLMKLLAEDLWRRPMKGPKTRPLVTDQLSTHAAGTVDYGSRARNHAVKLASGELIAYLDDDNAYRPEHLELLAEAFDDPTIDFAWTKLITHPGEMVIGSMVPQYGNIDTSIIMHRADTLQRFGWWPEPHELEGDKHAPDWGVVERWLTAGANWAHVPVITVDYYTAT